MMKVREFLEQNAIIFRKDDNSKFEVGKLYVSLDALDYNGDLDKLKLREKDEYTK